MRSDSHAIESRTSCVFSTCVEGGHLECIVGSDAHKTRDVHFGILPGVAFKTAAHEHHDVSWEQGWTGPCRFTFHWYNFHVEWKPVTKRRGPCVDPDGDRADALQRGPSHSSGEQPIRSEVAVEANRRTDNDIPAIWRGSPMRLDARKQVCGLTRCPDRQGHGEPKAREGPQPGPNQPPSRDRGAP